jgi:hypothetical protein
MQGIWNRKFYLKIEKKMNKKIYKEYKFFMLKGLKGDLQENSMN